MRLKHDSEMMMILLMMTMLMVMRGKLKQGWNRDTDSVAAVAVDGKEVVDESGCYYPTENTAVVERSYCFEIVDGCEVGDEIEVDHKHRHLILSEIFVDRYLPFDEK